MHRRLTALIDDKKLSSHVLLGRQSCFGRCRHGPNVYVRPVRPSSPLWHVPETTAPQRPRSSSTETSSAALYHYVSEHDVATIVDRHLMGDRVVAELTRRTPPPSNRFGSSLGSGSSENS